MATKSKQRAASTIAAQTMELREEPRRFIVSQSSLSPLSPVSPVSPNKPMTFASEEDDPPAYINDYRTRNHPSWTRVTRASSWRNLSGIPSVRSPSPTFSGEFSPRQSTQPQKEMPLRPNRREDTEFGKEDFSSQSQVLLPVFSSKKPMRKKSSGGNSGKSWLRDIKSPIGKTRPCIIDVPSRLLITASPRHDAIGSIASHSLSFSNGCNIHLLYIYANLYCRHEDGISRAPWCSRWSPVLSRCLYSP